MKKSLLAFAKSFLASMLILTLLIQSAVWGGISAFAEDTGGYESVKGYTFTFENGFTDLTSNAKLGTLTTEKLDETHGYSAYLSHTGPGTTSNNSPYITTPSFTSYEIDSFVSQFDFRLPDLNYKKVLGSVKFNTATETGKFFAPINISTDGSFLVNNKGTFSAVSDIVIKPDTWYTVKYAFYLESDKTVYDVYLAEESGTLSPIAEGLECDRIMTAVQYINLQLSLSSSLAEDLTTSIYIDNWTVEGFLLESVASTGYYESVASDIFTFENSLEDLAGKANGGTLTTEKLDDAHGYSAYLSHTGPGSSSTSPYITSPNFQSYNIDAFVCQFDFRLPDLNHKKVLGSVKYNTATETGKFFTPINIGTDQSFSVNNKGSFSAVSGVTINTNTWYTVKYVFYLGEEKTVYNVYLAEADGALEPVAENLECDRVMTAIQYVNLQLSLSSSLAEDLTTSIYIDNWTVDGQVYKKYGEIIPEEFIEGETAVNAVSLNDTSASGSLALDLSKSTAPSFYSNLTENGGYTLWILAKSDADATITASIGETQKTVISTPGTNYTWLSFDEVTLPKGEITITFANAAATIDRILLVETSVSSVPEAEAKTWYPSTAQSEYPILVTEDTIGYVDIFNPGDRVAFIGDSITHRSWYAAELMNYYATRYPDTEFTYVNKGINGNRANQVLNRMNWDIKQASFNKAIIHLGMNDLNRNSWKAGLEENATRDKNRQGYFDTYFTGIDSIINKLQENEDLEQIILAGPTIYDSWSNVSSEPLNWYNNTLRSAGAKLKDYAKEHGYTYIDYNTPQLTATLYHLEKDASFTFMPDRIHPDRTGELITLYTFLKAQGESGLVAEVALDAETLQTSTVNADISGMTGSAEGISFTYAPKALPLAADEDYRKAEKIYPITDELNREILKITNLKEGVYDIQFNGETVVCATADQLSSGVNLADLESNPSQAQALKLKAFVDAKRNLEYNQRGEAQARQRAITDGKLSADNFLESAQAYLEANRGSDIANEIDNAINDALTEKNLFSQMQQYEETIFSMNTLPTYQVTVTESDTAATYELQAYEMVYDDLPEDTINITPTYYHDDIVFSDASFTDTNGIAISSLPQNGIAMANITAINRSVQSKDIMVIAAAYKGDTLVASDFVIKEIARTSQEKMEFQLAITDGCSQLKIFFWENNTLVPISNMSDMATSNVKLKALYVNGTLIDGFDSEQTEYTYYLDYYENALPSIEAYPEDNAAGINIDLSDSSKALITITTPFGQQKTVTVNMVKTPLPMLTGIYCDGSLLSDFDPDTYAYTVSGSNITATAAEGLTVEKSTDADGVTFTVIPPKGISRSYRINQE